MTNLKSASQVPLANGSPETAPVGSKLSTKRKNWAFICWVLTWWFPDLFLTKLLKLPHASQRQSWREKLALCVCVFLASAVLLFWLEGLSALFCGAVTNFPLTNFVSEDPNAMSSTESLVIMNGRIYDTNYMTSNINEQSFINSFSVYNRLDASTINPPSIQYLSAITDPDISEIVVDIGKSQSWRQATLVNSGTDPSVLNNCPHPHSYPSNYDNSLFTNRIQCITETWQYGLLRKMYKGHLLLTKKYILKNDDANNYLIIIDYDVYDIGPYIAYTPYASYFLSGTATASFGSPNATTVSSVGRPTNLDFLAPAVTALLADALQMTDRQLYSSEHPTILTPTVIRGLQKLFGAGVVDDPTVYMVCTVGNDALTITAGIVYGIIVVKFLFSIRLAKTKQPEYQQGYVVLMAPCYTEGEAGLKKTFDSLVNSDYDDRFKLLLVICDGMVTGKNDNGETNRLSTPDLALEVLKWNQSSEEEVLPRSYESLGEGIGKHNRAKVYSGHYTTDLGHSAPYVVIVKCGKPSENFKPGNRGKRDSQIIMMNFFKHLIGTNKPEEHAKLVMSELEYELYRTINFKLKINPKVFEYVLMVDADTRILPDSLNKLVHRMNGDRLILACCGETRVENDSNCLEVVQQYEYYVSHHMGKTFESLFSAVTCLPGCFSMYRIKARNLANETTPPQAFLVHGKILEEYAVEKVHTLHGRNLLHLGEDRYLTTLLLKHFPHMRLEFVPDATCYTNVPADFKTLLSQRRRWINSTFHNLYELLQIPDGSCLTALCSMHTFFFFRVLVGLDFFSTMIGPIGSLYLVYVIFKIALEGIQNYWVVVVGFVAMYAMQIVIFMLRGEWHNFRGLLTYLLGGGLFLFNFILPAYAFWHFDDFSWGATRQVVGGNKGVEAAVSKEEMEKREIEKHRYDNAPVPKNTISEWERSDKRNFHFESGTVERSKFTAQDSSPAKLTISSPQK